MHRKIKTTVWNEFRHEREPEHEARATYPVGMHKVIAQALSAEQCH